MFILSGKIYDFALNGHLRKYVVLTLPYKTAKTVFVPDKYSSTSEAGEQREIVASHAKKLKAEMLAGRFTPTAIAVGVRETDRMHLNVKDDVLSANFPDGVSLPLLDAGHRFHALELLFKESADSVKKQVEDLPVTALVYLDGDTRQDFLNLQLGRPVDKTHMLSLQVASNLVTGRGSEFFKPALAIAKLLNSAADSPFHKQIRFDSRGIAGIPFSTLSAKGASDIATSLIGSAKLLTKFKAEPEWFTQTLISATKALVNHAPATLDIGKPLCPPPNGTKGSSTMLIGVANVFAYRLLATKKDKAELEDIDKLAEDAKRSFAGVIEGNFSGPLKRKLLGDFTYHFLDDMPGQEHDGIPLQLIELFSTSTFGVEKISKKRGPKSKQAGPLPANSEAEVIEELPDGTPVPETETEDWSAVDEATSETWDS